MKLKTFNLENSTIPRGLKPPRVNINLESGLISISKQATALMSLEPGDQVEILQDEDNLQDWYICKVDTGGFTLRDTPNSNLVFNSKAIVRAILESVDAKIEKQSVSLPIAGQPTKLGKQTLFGILAIAAKR